MCLSACLPGWLPSWLTNWRTDWRTDRLTDWLTDWHTLTDHPTDLPIDLSGWPNCTDWSGLQFGRQQVITSETHLNWVGHSVVDCMFFLGLWLWSIGASVTLAIPSPIGPFVWAGRRGGYVSVTFGLYTTSKLMCSPGWGLRGVLIAETPKSQSYNKKRTKKCVAKTLDLVLQFLDRNCFPPPRPTN